MSRTLELGRAVLGSQSASLQLWLTTSITLSSQDESTNLKQLNPTQIIEDLLSGKYWVCRGNGLHLALELTVQGESLDCEKREQLARSITNAPVWRQLNLRASIPETWLDDALQEVNETVIRVNIDHLTTEARPSRPHRHRIGLNVPFADVSPPVAIPVMRLQSVKLDMAFLRSKAKPNAKKQKVSKKNDNPKAKPSFADLDPQVRVNPGTRQDGLSAAEAETICPQRDADIVGPSPETHIGDGKEAAPDTKQASEILADLLAARGEKRKMPPKSPVGNDAGSGMRSQEISEISKCIDAALRLSVCKGMVKLPQGIKLVTNNFMATLSEICPAVWRLQYLPVYAICLVWVSQTPTDGSRPWHRELISCPRLVAHSSELGRK